MQTRFSKICAVCLRKKAHVANLVLSLATGLLAAFAPQAQAVTATGGTVTNYTHNGTNFTAHIFTNSGTLTVTSSGSAQYLVIAGGGGGGGGHSG